MNVVLGIYSITVCIFIFKLLYVNPSFFCSFDFISLNQFSIFNLLINLKSFIEKNNLEQQVYQYTEPSFHFRPIPKINYNFKLQGYFQSFKYFQDQKTEIDNLIGLKELHSNVLSTYSQYFNTKNPVISLHFRIGDYKYLTDLHPILDNKYYINAITFIKDTLKNDKLSILCFNEKQDDIIVKKNINALKSKFTNCEFIQIDYSIEDWNQLLIMCCCHHNIIANSSFSKTIIKLL